MNEPTIETIEPAPEVPGYRAAGSCDFCHAGIDSNARFARLTIALNEQGPRLSNPSTIEEETELTVCTRCEPAVTLRVERLLTELWSLMDESQKC